MSSVHQASVREETERIKAEFSRLSSSKQMSVEVQLLFQSMLTLINLLIAIFMEKATKKNNKNSSIPSSQTDKDETDLKTTSRKGKGLAEIDRVAM